MKFRVWTFGSTTPDGMYLQSMSAVSMHALDEDRSQQPTGLAPRVRQLEDILGLLGVSPTGISQGTLRWKKWGSPKVFSVLLKGSWHPGAGDLLEVARALREHP